jgi:phosphate transport system substrate-binding protein
MKPVRMSLHREMLALIVIAMLMTACNGRSAEATPQPVASPQMTLKVSGSGSTSAILVAIAPMFEAATPGYRLEVLPGSGTGGGVEGVLDGVLDIATMARPPKDDEAIEYVEIGEAAQTIITHPEVGITNLTTAQIAAIFVEGVTNWSEVGGPDLALILYVRDEDDSSTKALRSFIIGEAPFAETVVKVFTSQSDMIAAVEGTPGSVGIATWPTARADDADVTGVAVGGIAPGDSAYPMATPLGIGFLTVRQADVQPLIDWLLSEQGKAALSEFDMITE